MIPRSALRLYFPVKSESSADHGRGLGQLHPLRKCAMPACKGAAAWHRRDDLLRHRARGGRIARFAVFQLDQQRAFVAPSPTRRTYHEHHGITNFRYHRGHAVRHLNGHPSPSVRARGVRHSHRLARLAKSMIRAHRCASMMGPFGEDGLCWTFALAHRSYNGFVDARPQNGHLWQGCSSTS